MRDILFRGKRKEHDFFGLGCEWVYGIPIRTHIGTFICFEENPHYCGQYGYMEIEEISKVIPETVGQFTGLTDKNGNKIFEGDILRFYNGEEFSNYEVIWFGNAYKVLMEGEMEIQDDLDLFFCEHSEVIGNIHDNPELLEKKK